MNLLTALTAALAFIISISLTGWFRRYALKDGLLDVPNERSSHVTPTPRGGGVAIVIAVLVALPILGALHVAEWQTVKGLITAGILAAGIGYADDRAQVPLLVRLLVQFAAAASIVVYVGYGPVLQAIPALTAFAWVGAVLAVLYLVWMLNLTNFMDGIDGIASLEAISICAGTALCVLFAATVVDPLADALTVGAALLRRDSAVAVAAVLAAASLGFLRWNWPPAKIFMGDAGSGFLGVLLGALSLIAGRVQPNLMWSCAILAGVFVVDATTTLFRRIARREKFYHAHRSHAYQHAAQRYGHMRVTVTVGVINVCWLLPWALLAARGTLHGAVAMALAYIPLLAAALRFKAGLPD
ncbi:MAG: glycosyltransferase family 4 protein [Gemmatimonadaceae bacterium]